MPEPKWNLTTRQHVLQVLSALDDIGRWRTAQPSNDWVLRYRGRLYPPKEVAREAFRTCFPTPGIQAITNPEAA